MRNYGTEIKPSGTSSSYKVKETAQPDMKTFQYLPLSSNFTTALYYYYCVGYYLTLPRSYL
jgi:hypothetical protein